MAKMTQKHPYLWRSPQKSSTQNENFFFDFDKTCWIRRGFEQFTSSIAWRVIGLQSSARKVAHAGLKGLNTAICLTFVSTNQKVLPFSKSYLFSFHCENQNVLPIWESKCFTNKKSKSLTYCCGQWPNYMDK